MGLVFLDEVVFEKQCILFSIYHNKLNIGNLPDQHLNLPADGVDLCEIGVDALLKVLGLTYIDDLILVIKELVNTRFWG